ncbi:hypothetical protein FLP10_14525 [Agromyces intestinalis]|uniref:Uncharacterized protein n=1 Tax=Agromyces intestinalis TaxID=2592652 RepID=A0A5C1YK06_9MICO|nr:hypothetical protein [Agromyces intestinalis]QEO15509.1 hypothetical protein FLP10_14525 [Agromyces intestinalis]
MDAGLIFAFIWSVLAIGWGALLVVKRDDLAKGSRQQESKGLGATRRWSLSARAVGWVGVVFLLVGVVTLVLGIVGATR